MTSSFISAAISDALTFLVKKLSRFQGQYLVGGSCGLLLQGVNIASEPRDLDMYTDEEITSSIYECLKSYSIDQNSFSQTDIYRSWLSHYIIEGMKVELVGGFRVECLGSIYQVDISLCNRYASQYDELYSSIRLMPLAHELLFNVMRNRADRYNSIAAKMSEDLIQHREAFHAIFCSNQWSDTHVDILRGLVPSLIPEGGWIHA